MPVGQPKIPGSNRATINGRPVILSDLQLKQFGDIGKRRTKLKKAADREWQDLAEGKKGKGK